MHEHPAGIYLHIPFCRRKCHYCDFNSHVSGGAEREVYVSALLTEIRWWGRMLVAAQDEGADRHAAHSLYVGGGTPSLLTPAQLERLLLACVREIGLERGAEVTIEANPESASPDWLRSVRALGFNRLSLGVQSFDDQLLRKLGRLHSVADALRCYDNARGIGFDNVNLDLIFGLDSQSLPEWRRSLDKAIQLSPEHVSLYGLTVEDGTPLSLQVSGGAYVPADAETSAGMYILAEDLLEGAGYEHYEVSNWAKPGKHSRHNLNYWEMGPYLGCGAGAHSCLGQFRFWAVPTPGDYVEAWTQTEATPSERVFGLPQALPESWPSGAMAGWEKVSTWMRFQERVMLGLRTLTGISLDAFRRQSGYALEEIIGPTLMELRAEGLLESSGGCVRATRVGRLVLDEVLVRLFTAAEGFEDPRGEN